MSMIIYRNAGSSGAQTIYSGVGQKMLSFIGGRRLSRLTRSLSNPTMTVANARIIRLPMRQDAGAEAIPTVKCGDSVAVGQVIGRCPKGEIGCDIHSSVSGTVTHVGTLRLNGADVEAITIENDMEYRAAPFHPFTGTLHDASPEELIDYIRMSGLTGLGGAGYPVWAKLAAATGRVTKFLVNCCGSEPACTSDALLLKESSHDIISGIKVMMKILRVKHADIYISEHMYREACELINHIRNRTLLDVRLTKDKYPQGDERQLLAAAFRIELPYNRLPIDSEAVVFSAATCCAVYRTLLNGVPMVSKLVTVDGDRLRTPRNLQVPLGISFRDALAACDGDDNITQVIENGLMSGTMNPPDDSVVTKRTFCITAQNEFHMHSGNLRDCIRCGQCENVCPMRLPVTHIRARWIAGDIKGCADLGIALCVGCGLCSTECCADIPLAELMRSIKAEISANEGRCYGE